MPLVTPPSLWKPLSEDVRFIAKCREVPKVSTGELVVFARSIGFECGQTTVHRAMHAIRGKTYKRDREEPAAPVKSALPPGEKLYVVGEDEARTVSGDSMSVTLPCTLIQTEEDLIRHCQIDVSRWYIESMKYKAYQGFIKNAEKKIEKTQLYSLQATLKKHKGVEEAGRIIADFLADANAHAPVYTPISYPSFVKGEGHLLELALFDAHVGKMCWAEETGSHYDLETAREAFLASVDYLVGMASGFKIERILLPLGNDFFNSEGKSRATTNGTPQEDVCRWQKSFSEGRRLVVDAIDRLRCVAPVDVVMVPGNHDHERVYHLGEVLEAWYRNCEDVIVDNSPPPRKFYVYRDTLIMFTHGNEENPRDLPIIMATQAPQLWGASKFREVHRGHFHKRKETKYIDVDENTGVRDRILPSLSGVDGWHAQKGYASNRSAIANVFHPTRGCVGNFSHNLMD